MRRARCRCRRRWRPRSCSARRRWPARARSARGSLRSRSLYLSLQSLYSGPLKHIVIIDVLTIAIGFVLRAVAGAVAVNVGNQPLAAGVHDPAGAVHLAGEAAARDRAAGRRRREPPADSRRIQRLSARSDDRGRHGVDLIAYVFYTISPGDGGEVRHALARADDSVSVVRDFSVPVSRAQRDGGGSPADLLLTDRPLLACVALWALAVALIIYQPSSDAAALKADSCYARIQRPLRLGERRADHGADPRAHPREARRRLHRAADPRAGGGQAREVSRSARRAIRPARSVPKAMPAYEPPDLPNYSFEDDTLFESHRGTHPVLPKAASARCSSCFFNPNPLIRALHIQAQLNTMYAEREAQRESIATRDRSAVLRADPQPRRRS